MAVDHGACRCGTPHCRMRAEPLSLGQSRPDGNPAGRRAARDPRMFTLFVRLLGLFALAGAVVGLVVDGTKTIAASSLTVTPLGQAWFSFDPGSLTAFQNFVASHVEAYVG